MQINFKNLKSFNETCPHWKTRYIIDNRLYVDNDDKDTPSKFVYLTDEQVQEFNKEKLEKEKLLFEKIKEYDDELLKKSKKICFDYHQEALDITNNKSVW